MLTRAIVRDQTLRRQTMFYVVLAAVGLLFLGSTFFAEFLREHPITFLFYWAACGWLTITSVLMATFDLLIVRASARAERRKLEATYLAEAERAAQEEDSPR
jgi:prolipoprotein diacylglyceryltransferase